MKVYVPLSPARSEHVYQPESPAHRKCYEPVSPRRKLSAFDKILKGIQDAPPPHNHIGKVAEAGGYVDGCPRCIYQRVSPVKKKPYRKMGAWRSYCRLSILNDRRRYMESLEIYNKVSENLAMEFQKKNGDICRRFFDKWRGQFHRQCNTHLTMVAHTRLAQFKKVLKQDLGTLKKTQERCLDISINERRLEYRKKTLGNCIREWRSACPTPKAKPKEAINVPNNPYHVLVKINVNENGHAEVKMSAPLAPIYDNYFKKFRKPPVDEYILALREFGYPEWVLDRMKARSLLSSPAEPGMSVMQALQNEEQKKKPKVKVVSKLTKLTKR